MSENFWYAVLHVFMRVGILKPYFYFGEYLLDKLCGL